jgi:hypothetical protein
MTITDLQSPVKSTLRSERGAPVVVAAADRGGRVGQLSRLNSHQVLYGDPSIDEVCVELECTSTMPLFV